MVNPMIVEGQTFGGAAQGIGTALFEESPYDENGQPLASTLLDYILPGPAELPRFRIAHRETLSPYSAHGIKGVGEGGAIAPGMLITARDIVLRLGEVDAKRIREELSGNLCRCTGYVGIVEAIAAVAKGRAPQAVVRPLVSEIRIAPEAVSGILVGDIAPSTSERGKHSVRSAPLNALELAPGGDAIEERISVAAPPRRRLVNPVGYTPRSPLRTGCRPDQFRG
jgi:hypothetical protein